MSEPQDDTVFPPRFAPRDHYWIVGGDESRLWSSAACTYVEANDAGYAVWQAGGRFPTRIASEDELRDVLKPYGLFFSDADYLADLRWRTAEGGTTWNGWEVPTDQGSRGSYVGAVVAMQAGLRAEGAIWKFPHGPEALSNAQLFAMASAVAAFVQRCFDAEASVLAALEEGPLSRDAIDAAFAAAMAGG